MSKIESLNLAQMLAIAACLPPDTDLTRLRKPQVPVDHPVTPQRFYQKYTGADLPSGNAARRRLRQMEKKR